jgi:glycosyltransferase involved in cell wall biosynthesis
MAYGLPCIGVTGQSMGEIIRHRETGILVPPEDVNALADVFTELLRDEELRHQMGQAGYKLVANEFLWDHVVDHLAPLINNAIERFHK